MSIIKDPDLRRKEQWEKSAQAKKGFNFAKLLGFGDLGGPALSAAEEYSLHQRYLAKANSLNLSEIAEMKIMYVNSSFLGIFFSLFSIHGYFPSATVSFACILIFLGSIAVTVAELTVKGVQLWLLLALTFFFAVWTWNDLFYM